MIQADGTSPDALAAAALDAIFAAQPKLADDLLARAAAGL
jgi:electron transfer flavoprotein beta subunit